MFELIDNGNVVFNAKTGECYKLAFPVKAGYKILSVSRRGEGGIMPGYVAFWNPATMREFLEAYTSE